MQMKYKLINMITIIVISTVFLSSNEECKAYQCLAPTSQVKKVTKLKDYFAALYKTIHERYPELFEHVRRYKSDAFYYEINAVLRSGQEGFAERLRSAGRPEKEISIRIDGALESIKHINKFFEHSIIDREIVVYRKVSSSTIDKIISSESAVFIDTGYVSTCYTKKAAKKYHKVELIKIVIPKGTRVIDMVSALEYTDWAGKEWEDELTIDRGYKYAVEDSDDSDCKLSLRILIDDSFCANSL